MDDLNGTEETQYRSFWLGCSDDPCLEYSKPPDLRSEKLLQTSLANQMPHSDLGIIAALEWAINVQDIERVVICGHYGCKVIDAAFNGKTSDIVGHWLLPLKKIVAEHEHWLSKLPVRQRLDALCELNAIYQTLNTSKSAAIQTAWKKTRAISLTAVVNEIAAPNPRGMNFVLTADSVPAREVASAIDALKKRWIDVGGKFTR